MRLDKEISPSKRAEIVEKQLGVKLPLIKGVGFEDEKKVHCENLIGGTTIPLGIAGPILIRGDFLKGEHYLPLATTEGALVASVNRGCKAIGAEGVSVHIENKGITRGPVFEVKGMKEGIELRKWLREHFKELEAAASKTSSHLRLNGLASKQAGTRVYVRFSFDTGQAMGMNMATIASTALAGYIEKETGASCLAVSGNFCIDKKPGFINFLQGRGREAWGEAILSRRVLEEVLRITPEKLEEVWLAKCMIGSAMAGSMGYNAHYANIIAALYAATGQDLAHVVEGSLGMTTVRMIDKDRLSFGVYLPALVLGTVGGGTKLDIKKEALSILRVTSSDELAEAVTAAVLAGELSLLASLAENTLAQAHRALGR